MTDMQIAPKRMGIKYTEDEVCVVEVCDRQAFKRGLCMGHHKRFQRNGDPGDTPLRTITRVGVCQVEHCTNKKIRSRGMCNKHYTRWRRGSDLRCDRQIIKNLDEVLKNMGVKSPRKFIVFAGCGPEVLYHIRRGRPVNHYTVAKIVDAVARLQEIKRKTGMNL